MAKLKSTYIYGETFIKTKKFLYLIGSSSDIFGSKLQKSYYIAVNSYSDQKGKTNIFRGVDGNNHISECKRTNQHHLLFNEINKSTHLFIALQRRIA